MVRRVLSKTSSNDPREQKELGEHLLSVPVQPVLPPLMISLSPCFPAEYSHGFKKPSGGLPAVRRALLSSEIMPAKAGADALLLCQESRRFK